MFDPNIKQQLSKALKISSHPVRREILKLLRKGESLSAAELTDILGLDRYNLYHHLGILNQADLIVEDKEKSIGKRIYYKILALDNPDIVAFSFNKDEMKENKKIVKKILDNLAEIENFEIPNRNKISMIEVNISYEY